MKKKKSLYAVLTEAEARRINRVVIELRDLGRGSVKKGDAMGALILAAIDCPEAIRAARELLRGRK